MLQKDLFKLKTERKITKYSKKNEKFYEKRRNVDSIEGISEKILKSFQEFRRKSSGMPWMKEKFQ